MTLTASPRTVSNPCALTMDLRELDVIVVFDVPTPENDTPGVELLRPTGAASTIGMKSMCEAYVRINVPAISCLRFLRCLILMVLMMRS